MHRRQLVAGLVACSVVPARAIAGVACGPGPNGLQLCQAGLPTAVADGINAQQEDSQWCWAACIHMVFLRYGYRVSQRRIVEAVFGSTANAPGTPVQILACLNRGWTSDDGKSFRASGTAYGVSAPHAAQDLAADRPLIVGTMRHAMVLTAVSYLRAPDSSGQIVDATVRDPWPRTGGRRSLTPPEWAGIDFVARVSVEGTDCDDGKVPCTHVAHPAGDVAPCEHPAHPNGDLGLCEHGPMHPNGDVAPCGHPCMGPWGPGPCHPAGDLYPCRHGPAHPAGDVHACTHPAHRSGDSRPCQHVLHPDGDDSCPS